MARSGVNTGAAPLVLLGDIQPIGLRIQHPVERLLNRVPDQGPKMIPDPPEGLRLSPSHEWIQ